MTPRLRSVFLATLASVEHVPEITGPAFRDHHRYGQDALEQLSLESVDRCMATLTALKSLTLSLEQSQYTGMSRTQVAVYYEGLNALPVASRAGLPSMESFEVFPDNATDVSLEAMRESTRRTLKALLALLVQFWLRLMDFVQGLTQSTTLMKQRIALVKGDVRGLSGRYPKGDTVQVRRYIPYLSTSQRLATNHLHLIENLQVLERQLSYLRQHYLPQVKDLTKQFISLFGQWGQVEPQTWLAALNNIALQFQPVITLGLNDRNSEGCQGAELPGYKILQLNVDTLNDSVTGNDQMAKAAALQATVVRMENLQLQRDVKTYTMPVLSPIRIDSVLNGALNLTQEIERFNSDSTRRTLKAFTLDLERLSKQTIEVPPGQMQTYQAGMAYARTLTRWLKEPYLALVSHAILVCHQSVRFCNLHSRAYKEVPIIKES